MNIKVSKYALAEEIYNAFGKRVLKDHYINFDELEERYQNEWLYMAEDVITRFKIKKPKKKKLTTRKSKQEIRYVYA